MKHVPILRRGVQARAKLAAMAWMATLTGFLASAMLYSAQTAWGQDIDALVFSTQPGGGALVLAGYDFGEKIRVNDRLGFCPGGQCFYSTTDPGFRTPSGSQPAEGLHALAPGTPVSFELVAIDAGVSFKVGANVIDGVGESVRLGEALAMHVHPEYQVQAAQGVVDDFAVSFRLTTTSPQYGDSQVVGMTLTNGDTPATPTGGPATPTPSPTQRPTDPATATATHTEPPAATSTPSRTPTFTVPPNDTCDGDCNGDSAVSIAELIRGVNIALGSATVAQCPAFDINGNGTVSISELISAVSDALDGC